MKAMTLILDYNAVLVLGIFCILIGLLLVGMGIYLVMLKTCGVPL